MEPRGRSDPERTGSEGAAVVFSAAALALAAGLTLVWLIPVFCDPGAV